MTRNVVSFTSFCFSVKAGDRCILDVLGLESKQNPHQITVRASALHYQQWTWSLCMGCTAIRDEFLISLGYWRAGLLADVKCSGGVLSQGASHHGLQCWALPCVTKSFLGQWDPLVLEKHHLLWLLCNSLSPCSSDSFLFTGGGQTSHTMTVCVSRGTGSFVFKPPLPLSTCDLSSMKEFRLSGTLNLRLRGIL